MQTVHTPTPRWQPRFLLPRFWPTWLMCFCLWLLSQLPYSIQMSAGRLIGRLAWYFARQRRHITETNIRLCFPEHGESEQTALARAHFLSLGQGIVETALCWWARDTQLQERFVLVGEEHMQAALERGKGVLLLSAHFTTLELGGRLLSLRQPFHVLYRPHKNAVFEWIMHRARRRRFEKAIPRNDTRGLLNSLKANQAVWYAPDQNHGGPQSVFAPFFGISASTLTSTSRIAAISGAAVVPFFQMRLPDNSGYLLLLCPALDNFPSDNYTDDAARTNALIESVIREMPAQYLWAHRRFKTRPPGEDYPY